MGNSIWPGGFSGAVLEQKYGPLPESVLQRIEGCNQVQKLEEAVLAAPQLANPEEVAGMLA